MCEVHGLNNLGHPVSLVTTTEIVAPEVSLENVVELMMSVKKDQVLQPDPPENCHLTVKNCQKLDFFFLIEKNDNFFHFFGQFFDSQMAIFRRVRSVCLIMKIA